MLVNDVRPAGNGAHKFMEFHFILLFGQTIEYDHLRVLYLIEHELAHICIIGKEGFGIDKRHDLIDHPTFRHSFIKLVQKPHAVIFH